MTTTIVRPWRPADRPAVLALNAELQEHERAPRASRRPGADRTDGYVAALESALADDGQDGALFVAEAADGSGVVGFLACFVGEGELASDPRELTVHDLVVTARARRRGVGRRLLAAARAFAAERGIRRVVVSVLAANELAATAYRAMGLRPVALVLELEAGTP